MDNLGVEPDAIVIPVGGGGLLAGMVTVIQHFKPNMEIIVSLFDALQQAYNQSVTLYCSLGMRPVQLSSSMTPCS